MSAQLSGAHSARARPFDPDFFIVGAPRCGTTALYRCLRAHPTVFMPSVKEPHFFGTDLVGRAFIRDRHAYEALFEPAGRHTGDSTSAVCCGEASVFYLVSRRAAREISAVRPDARIIVMLRDPLEVMRSLHGELYHGGHEPIADFARALDAEDARRFSRDAGSDRYPPEVLWYRHVVDFAPQVRRFLDIFGTERVHVIQFEDLVADAPSEVGSVLRFLGVDDRTVPPLSMANASKRVRHPRFHEALMRPPKCLQRVARATLPMAVRRRLIGAAQKVNTVHRPRDPMPAPLRAALRAELRPGIERLQALIDRDLSSWMGDGAPS